jgi:CBS domain-containing protein
LTKIKAVTGTPGEIITTRAPPIMNGREAFAHRARIAGGCQLCDAPVETVMTREVATCKQSDTVYELMERMTTGKFRHVPVIDNGRLAGIVSIGDVVKYRLAEMAFESNALRQYIATA